MAKLGKYGVYIGNISLLGARHGRGMDAAVSKALVGVFASQKLQS